MLKTKGNSAAIVGVYEHPARKTPDKTDAQLHLECALGALADAALSLCDVDGYFCAGDVPGMGAIHMAEYLGIRPSYIDNTELGGASYLTLVAHACQAIEAGKCNVALITLAGRPRSDAALGMGPPSLGANIPEDPYEVPFGLNTVASYAMLAARHMYEFGTTSEQLAWIKVAASDHAQHNPQAMRRELVSGDDVLGSPIIASPLHRLDCCVVSDGGGAIVVARRDLAPSTAKSSVALRGSGAAIKGHDKGALDLSYTAAAWSSRAAFDEAGLQ